MTKPRPKPYFRPYKKRAEEIPEFPSIFQFSDQHKQDLVRYLLGLPEGQMLYRVIVEELDKIVEFASCPAIADRPHTVSHANGGVHVLREFMRKLEQIAHQEPQKKPLTASVN